MKKSRDSRVGVMSLGETDALGAPDPRVTSRGTAPAAERSPADVQSRLLCVDRTRAHHIVYEDQTGETAVGVCVKTGPGGEPCGYSHILSNSFTSAAATFRLEGSTPLWVAPDADESRGTSPDGPDNISVAIPKHPAADAREVRLLRYKLGVAVHDLRTSRMELAQAQDRGRVLEEAFARSEQALTELRRQAANTSEAAGRSPDGIRRKGGASRKASGPRTKRREVLARSREKRDLATEAEARAYLAGWADSAKNMVGLL
ncbi:MAG: hypothetical protein WD533_06515 [Dehalococcoidia bacterium]